jgi:hypothetical protein
MISFRSLENYRPIGESPLNMHAEVLSNNDECTQIMHTQS